MPQSPLRSAAWPARVGVAAFLATLAGCALDWSFQSAGGGRDGGSSSGSSGTSGSSGASGSSGSSGSSSGTSGTSGSDAGRPDTGPPDAGPTCTSNAQCGSGYICHYADHQCGQGQPGHCQAIRTGCNNMVPATCACDGTVDNDECASNGRGQDTSTTASCNTPGFRYRCGDQYCITGVSFSEFCVQRSVYGNMVYSCDNAFNYNCSDPSCSGCNVKNCTCAPTNGGAVLTCP